VQDTWKCIVHVCHRTLYVWTALSRSCGQSAAWIKRIDKAPWSVIIYHSEFYQHVDSNLICGQVMSNLQATLKINEFLLNRTHWVRQSPPISIFHLNNSPTAPPIDIDNHIQGINWSIVLEKVLIARASNVHLTNIEISGLGIFILRATMGFRQIMIWRSCINWLKNWLSALGVPQQQSMTGYPVARSVETEREKKREEVVVERERRVEVLVCPRKGQALSKWTKDESLSIQKEATIQVRFSITITAKTTRASSPISVHQPRAVDHLNTPICVLTAWHETHSKGGHSASHGKKLLCYKTAKAPSNTTTSSPPVSLHPRFPQIAISRVHYILRISQISTGHHPVQSWSH